MSQQRFHRYQPEPDQDDPAVKTIVISVVLIPVLARFVALNALILFAIAYNKRTMGGFDL